MSEKQNNEIPSDISQLFSEKGPELHRLLRQIETTQRDIISMIERAAPKWDAAFLQLKQDQIECERMMAEIAEKGGLPASVNLPPSKTDVKGISWDEAFLQLKQNRIEIDRMLAEIEEKGASPATNGDKK